MKKAGFLFIGGMIIVSAGLIAGLGGTPHGKTGPVPSDPPVERFVTGRNVNMVSGTKLPWGDPWLQRQNEPSVAVSTRNPMHLFAVANDYRTIDMPDDPRLKVPGIPLQIAQARDAWIGVFKSFDGGQSWITTLLHGYPQQDPTIGQTSPIYGYDTACDPFVRAGANGFFYMSGIAFNRSGRAGSVFVSRWIDNNNLEKVRRDAHGRPEKDSIEYLDTKIVGVGNPGQFIDMPSLAVDIPRAGSGSYQGIPNARVYLAYTIFPGSTGKNVRSKLYFARSTTSGRTWYTPIKISESQNLIQRAVIAIDPKDATGRTIYVAYRRFLFDVIPDAIVVVKSIDGGATFTKPIVVATIPYPFDQVMNDNRFRTNSYPTMAVDHNGIVSIAWAERRNRASGQADPAGQARIVVSSSANGVTWTQPQPIELADSSGYLDGHQLMPSMSYAGGKLMLVWYDQRGTLAKKTDPASCVTEFIQDDPNADYRHTLDVRAAEGVPLAPGVPPSFFPSQQVSRYLYYLDVDEVGDPIVENGYYKLVQAEDNPVNFPLFHQGTRPFIGDYIDLAASPQVLPPPITPVGSGWMPNINGLDNPTSFHAAWADNRDVRPPLPDWWSGWEVYSPPDSDQPDLSLGKDYVCTGNTAGRRNQNVYTASLSNGVQVGSPGNTKHLTIAGGEPGGRRTFSVFVRNLTELDERRFVLSFGTIAKGGGANASFKQMGDQLTRGVTLGAFSSASITVYVDKNDSVPLAPVKIDVHEVTPTGNVLVGYALLNPDSTNGVVVKPDDPLNNALGDEDHTPHVSDPKIWKYDVGSGKDPHSGAMNPRAQNPRAQNSGLVNPRAQNENLENPRAQNKSMTNENIVNSETGNPRAQNPRALNTALTDMTWDVTNQGNTTSCYQFDVLAQADETLNTYFSEGKLYGQLLVYKVHTTPLDSGCTLKEEHHDELIINVTNPRAQNPRAQNTSPTARGLFASSSTEADEPDITADDATFWLAPGEQAHIIFRVKDPDTTDNIDFEPQMVAAEVEAQAVNTGATTPVIVTQPDIPWETAGRLPGFGSTPASIVFRTATGGGPAESILAIWNEGGGELNYTISWTVEDATNWLTGVTPSSRAHLIPGVSQTHTVSIDTTGLSSGSHLGTITITDPFATNNPLRVPVSVYVSGTPPGLSITTTIIPDAVRNMFYYALLGYAGGSAPVTWSIPTGTLPPGLSLDPDTGLIYGTPTVADTFSFVVQAEDSLGQSVTQALSMTVADWLAKYNGPESSQDEGWALAVDSAGNAHVTGLSMGSGTGYDYATVKYDNNGSEAWAAAARYDGPAHEQDDGSDIVVDALGNTYVTGLSWGVGTNFDYATIKYDSSGNQVWVARYDGPGHGYDSAKSIAVDAMGNVFVTGHAWNGTDEDFVTIKYDRNGNELWVATYDGPASAGFDYGEALALDPAGNVYVTGYSTGIGTGEDIAIVKYDGSGNELWVARVNYANNQDRASAIAVDHLGNVYAAGYTVGVGPGYSYAIVKYDTTGTLKWARYYDGPGGDDLAQAIAVDPAGYVYVTGLSQGSGGTYDYATIKLDSDGDQSWAARYDGPAAGYDCAEALAFDPHGNVYVTGFSFVGGTDDYEYATVKYDTDDGSQLWAARYGSPGYGNDRGEDIALDPLGSIIVTGYSFGKGTELDYATIAYKQHYSMEIIVSTHALGYGLVGEPYAEVIRAFGGSGNRSWSVVTGTLPPGLSLNSTTGVISGTPTATGTYAFAVQVVDGALTPASMDLSITINGLTISGQIYRIFHLLPGDVNVPIPNVIVRFSGGMGTATTDPNGNYMKTVIPGWTGTVVPSVSYGVYYNYSPAFRTYSSITGPVAGDDYVASYPMTLFFNNQPGNTGAGQVISPALLVVLWDDNGVPVAGATVTIALGANHAGGTLTGAGAYNTGPDGTVLLNNLSINAVGTGYTIIATAGGKTVSTQPFDIF